MQLAASSKEAEQCSEFWLLKGGTDVPIEIRIGHLMILKNKEYCRDNSQVKKEHLKFTMAANETADSTDLQWLSVSFYPNLFVLHRLPLCSRVVDVMVAVHAQRHNPALRGAGCMAGHTTPEQDMNWIRINAGALSRPKTH